MKKSYVVVLVVLFALLTVNAFSADFTYVGADKCKMCHKSEKSGQQFTLWESRKHSKSFEALSLDKAVEVAGEAGVKGNPSESPQCLKCHAPLHEKAP
ncbi:MAG: cytochrome c family protein, partial [Acidobacteria bacterium]|nr:cytochrome c family protein [Acidobacteriota bacterium]